MNIIRISQSIQSIAICLTLASLYTALSAQQMNKPGEQEAIAYANAARMQSELQNAQTRNIQAKMRADSQRERHTRQLVCIILAAPLAITGVVALVVELLK